MFNHVKHSHNFSLELSEKVEKLFILVDNKNKLQETQVVLQVGNLRFIHFVTLTL